MSVIMVLRVPGDTDKFGRYSYDNGDKLERIAAEGKAAGAIHHLFAVGDGEIIVIDEWPDKESFQNFFDNQPEIPDLMRDGGATGAPEVTFYEKLDTVDTF